MYQIFVDTERNVRVSSPQIPHFSGFVALGRHASFRIIGLYSSRAPVFGTRMCIVGVRVRRAVPGR